MYRVLSKLGSIRHAHVPYTRKIDYRNTSGSNKDIGMNKEVMHVMIVHLLMIVHM